MYYRWLQAAGARTDNPCDGIHLKQPQHAPKRPFSEDDLRRLLAVCHRPQERALVLLLVDTGLRLGEIIRVCKGDLSGDELRVHSGKGGGDRIVALSASTVEALRACMNGREYAWHSQRLHGPMTKAGFYKLIKRLGRRASVEHAYPHRFRTTFACRFLEASDGDVGSAQVLMGHRKVETTLQYASYTKERRALAQQRRISLADRLG